MVRLALERLANEASELRDPVELIQAEHRRTWNRLERLLRPIGLAGVVPGRQRALRAARRRAQRALRAAGRSIPDFRASSRIGAVSGLLALLAWPVLLVVALSIGRPVGVVPASSDAVAAAIAVWPLAGSASDPLGSTVLEYQGSNSMVLAALLAMFPGPPAVAEVLAGVSGDAAVAGFLLATGAFLAAGLAGLSWVFYRGSRYRAFQAARRVLPALADASLAEATRDLIDPADAQLLAEASLAGTRPRGR